jgi:hypothetical protein
MPDAFHLAEFNISRLKAPLDAPVLHEFVAFLDPVNAFAEQSPGFVWRLAGADGQAASYLPPVFDDPLVITNLTVWTDLESLRTFAYQTVHRYFLQSRRRWFERAVGRQLVMWWVPAGHLPGLDEAKQRLLLLEERGASAEAFTFQEAFDSAGRPLPQAMRPELSDES